MMKSLLFIIASLALLSANAQMKKSDVALPHQPLSTTRVQPQVCELEMQMRSPDEVVGAPGKSSTPVKPFYRRPAGAFSSCFFDEGNGSYFQLPRNVLMLKPYRDYTYCCSVPGADENDEVYWNDQAVHWNEFDQTVRYGFETCDPPSLIVHQTDINRWACFQHPYYSEISDPSVSGLEAAEIYAVPTVHVFADIEEDEELLLSSKTMCNGGRDGDVNSMFLFYDGGVPFDTNMYGRWFGKNGGHFDGIAQAFEKPEHPYMLKKVGIIMGNIDCRSAVDLTCKVYRIDAIPDYRDDGSVELSEDSWELLATGRAKLTPDVENSGLVTFLLYNHDEDDPSLEYEVWLTIDDPILVVFEGYNDTEADGLHDFTCFTSADIHADEGFGELAYIKCPVNDDEGNFTGQYKWKGLNNFFSSGEMKTGYTIFIAADYPYLAFNNDAEDGKYTFCVEGGVMEIEFKSCMPSADDDWMVTCRGNDDEFPAFKTDRGYELPDWLDIELVDGEEDGEFNGIVTAVVTAQPRPLGTNYYRNAVVRFEIPGDYIDYTFRQPPKYKPQDGDYNQDGEVNLGDVNALIDLILHGSDLNVADLNALIDLILGNDNVVIPIITPLP
jgi:hypothetical protein